MAFNSDQIPYRIVYWRSVLYLQLFIWFSFYASLSFKCLVVRLIMIKINHEKRFESTKLIINWFYLLYYSILIILLWSNASSGKDTFEWLYWLPTKCEFHTLLSNSFSAHEIDVNCNLKSVLYIAIQESSLPHNVIFNYLCIQYCIPKFIVVYKMQYTYCRSINCFISILLFSMHEGIVFHICINHIMQ